MNTRTSSWPILPHVPQGRHPPPQPIFGEIQTQWKCSSWTTWPSTLTPSGRPGIIVPEGIIFQSQSAYKQLRRMLLEEYLVAVVTLRQASSSLTPASRPPSSFWTRSLAKRSNTSVSSKWKTTASTSEPSVDPSNPTTYPSPARKSPPTFATCAAVNPGRLPTRAGTDRGEEEDCRKWGLQSEWGTVSESTRNPHHTLGRRLVI